MDKLLTDENTAALHTEAEAGGPGTMELMSGSGGSRHRKLWQLPKKVFTGEG